MSEPIVVTEDMPGGAYRKAIYECIQSTIGRELSPAEHKYLSHILKLYAEAHVKRVSINNFKGGKKNEKA